MVKINFEQMPKLERRLLASGMLDVVERFFADPVNLAAFETWREGRKTT